MVFMDGDITEYYSWLIKRRYNIILKKPERGAHVSFINDSIKDLTLNGQRTTEEVEKLWKEVADKWDGKIIPITINLNPRTDDKYWWFNIPHEDRALLQGIREELGLGKPFWGMHMTIGDADATPITLEHSKYIHTLIKNGHIK